MVKQFSQGDLNSEIKLLGMKKAVRFLYIYAFVVYLNIK